MQSHQIIKTLVLEKDATLFYIGKNIQDELKIMELNPLNAHTTSITTYITTFCNYLNNSSKTKKEVLAYTHWLDQIYANHYFTMLSNVETLVLPDFLIGFIKLHAKTEQYEKMFFYISEYESNFPIPGTTFNVAINNIINALCEKGMSNENEIIINLKQKLPQAIKDLKSPANKDLKDTNLDKTILEDLKKPMPDAQVHPVVTKKTLEMHFNQIKADMKFFEFYSEIPLDLESQQTIIPKTEPFIKEICDLATLAYRERTQLTPQFADSFIKYFNEIIRPIFFYSKISVLLNNTQIESILLCITQIHFLTNNFSQFLKLVKEINNLNFNISKYMLNEYLTEWTKDIGENYQNIEKSKIPLTSLVKLKTYLYRSDEIEIEGIKILDLLNKPNLLDIEITELNCAYAIILSHIGQHQNAYSILEKHCKKELLNRPEVQEIFALAKKLQKNNDSKDQTRLSIQKIHLNPNFASIFQTNDYKKATPTTDQKEGDDWNLFLNALK